MIDYLDRKKVLLICSATTNRTFFMVFRNQLKTRSLNIGQWNLNDRLWTFFYYLFFLDLKKKKFFKKEFSRFDKFLWLELLSNFSLQNFWTEEFHLNSFLLFECFKFSKQKIKRNSELVFLISKSIGLINCDVFSSNLKPISLYNKIFLRIFKKIWSLRTF